MRTLQDVLPFETRLIETRRILHRHPETGFDLPWTHDFVVSRLREAGIPFTPHVGKHSIVAILENGVGPVLGLRADMDALPIFEANSDLPYRSECDGKMHACGHDAHTAILLETGRYLHTHREHWRGTVKLIFQEAEEGPNPGGAWGVCQSGLVDDVDGFFAFHVSPAHPVGTVAIKSGETMAAADTVKIRLLGKGCHAAYPHLGIDPIVMQAEAILAMQNIVSRKLDPTESAVLTIARVQAGTTHNVIPAFAELEGTVRTFNETTRRLMEAEIRAVLESVSARHGGAYEFRYIREYDPTYNDPGATLVFRRAIERSLGTQGFVPLDKPTMGAEDFSRYAAMKKGCIAWLGTRGDDTTGFSLHHPAFNIDESALKYGVLCFLNLVETYGKEE